MAGVRDGSLLAGRVGRAHGLDGSFYVTRARAQLLREGAEVMLGAAGGAGAAGRPLRIERRAGTDEHPIVRLEGISGREAAEALRGQELHVSSESSPELEPGEYWAEQLVGCRVHSGGVDVGSVAGLLVLPSCECLEVARGGDSPTLLVPMVRDAIRSIDVGERVIEIDLGFLGEAAESDGPPGPGGGA